MTKRVLFYARYSTDRQNEVSIETQVELGRDFAGKRGWRLVEVYSDAAVSGTSFHSRPGIQKLLSHLKRERIDIVLCVTVDRLSRDIEHSARILKDLRFQNVELWTVHAGAPIADLEHSLKALLSHDLVEQIRYRTREGMKTAVSKGKATTCLAYGYRLSSLRDANGDRVRGEREVVPEKAAIVRRIYEQYARGVSPRDIASKLNDEGVPGPRNKAWRDTAIRGHVDRGTGILNNQIYIGQMIWNRRTFRKDPDTERRVARPNDVSEWVAAECPDLRIVPDELWLQVKNKQAEVGESFAQTTTNRLNAAHRPSYLLSGLLQCADCGGPYAIMAKDRYGCTNYRKKLPIPELDGQRCTNQKTITRQNVEERVLSAVSTAFFSMNMFEIASKSMIEAKLAEERQNVSKSDLEALLKRLSADQGNIIQQISQRAAEGRPRLKALDDMLDQLEEQREEAQAQLQSMGEMSRDRRARIAELKDRYGVEGATTMVHWMLFDAMNGDERIKAHLIPIVRHFIQVVIVGKTPGHQPASLQVYGLIAHIFSAMDAVEVLERQFTARAMFEMQRLVVAGADSERKKEFLDRFAEELSLKQLEWADIQVSVVAGAGFEPAAFRL